MSETRKIVTMTSPDHGKYVGEAKGFIRHGQGTYTWKETGNRYTGSWVNGEMEGKGTLTYADGTKYVGMFKDGAENGQGCITFPSGFKYEGEFVDGQPIGFEEFVDELDQDQQAAIN